MKLGRSTKFSVSPTEPLSGGVGQSAAKFAAGLLLVFSLVSFVPVQIETAQAGELIAGPRRIRQTNQYSRRIERSTDAVKELRQARPTRPTTLRESSPYDYRIVRARLEQEKYEQRLARWEHRVAKQELRDQQKARKEKEREATKLRKERAKAREKLARAEEKRQKQLQREAARGSRLSTLTGQSQVASRATGAQSGERFAAPASQPRRLTLWQRIKLWFSGGSPESNRNM